MFNNNRHLNIFEHYTQKGALPIENNISRGLAILLNQDNLFFDRFIDYINAKCLEKKSECNVPKPQKSNEKEVGIQQQVKAIVSNCPNPKNIIGITLTTSAHAEWIENKKDDSNNLITDIVINCRDSLIVIEVKRNATDARLQLKQQVNSLLAEVVRQGGNVAEKELLEGTWEEIISILQDVFNLTNGNLDSLLGHYLIHLESTYPTWFPVSLLSDIDITRENEAAIEKRIHKLIQNCCEKENDEKKYSGRYIIPLNYEFTTEAQVHMDYEDKSLIVMIWAGDTKWQGYCLLNKTKNDLSWVYKNLISVEKQEFKVTTKPYLRLAHFQTTIIGEYINIDFFQKNFGSSKEKCMSLYSDISREWKRQNWEELKGIITSKYNGLINNDSFNAAFRNRFEDSNRGYAHVSFGFETTTFIPLDIIINYEKSGSPDKGNDQLALLVLQIINSLIQRVE